MVPPAGFEPATNRLETYCSIRAELQGLRHYFTTVMMIWLVSDIIIQMDTKQITPEQQADIEKNKDVAAMSYVWMLSVVVLYARKDSPFVQYHAKQGIWLFVISVPLWFVPVIGQYFEFFVLAGMIIGFLNAAQGKYHDVPVIGQLAKGTLTLMDIWKKLVSVILHAAGVMKRGIGISNKEASSQDKSDKEQ